MVSVLPLGGVELDCADAVVVVVVVDEMTSPPFSERKVGERKGILKGEEGSKNRPG